MFGPGLVLAAGAVGLSLIPNHPGRRNYCASMEFDSELGVRECPIKVDHRPAEVGLVVVLAVVALVTASWVTWRRHRALPARTPDRPYTAGRLGLSRVSAWLFGAATMVMAVVASSEACGDIIIYPYGTYQDCGSPAFFERTAVTQSMTGGIPSGKPIIDVCEQIATDRGFTAVSDVIATVLPTFPLGHAVIRSRRSRRR